MTSMRPTANAYESPREAGDHSLVSIVIFSGAGLLATLALMTLGIDLGAGWI